MDPEVGSIVTTVTMGNGVGTSVVMRGRSVGVGVGKSVGEGVPTQIEGPRDAGGGTHGPV